MEVKLVNDDGEQIESLKLDEIDPIFSDSFRNMIKDQFSEGKHFFVAKIQSKNVNWREAATTSVTVAGNSTSQVAPDRSQNNSGTATTNTE